jgi:hypothetical protein
MLTEDIATIEAILILVLLIHSPVNLPFYNLTRFVEDSMWRKFLKSKIKVGNGLDVPGMWFDSWRG